MDTIIALVLGASKTQLIFGHFASGFVVALIFNSIAKAGDFDDSFSEGGTMLVIGCGYVSLAAAALIVAFLCLLSLIGVSLVLFIVIVWVARGCPTV